MAIATLTDVVLEPAAQAFVEATATPPLLYELTPDEARKVLDDVQAAPIDKLPVDEHWITVPADVGDVQRARPAPARRRGHAAGDPLHARRRLGAGNAGTHDRLVRELVVGTGAALAFVEYDRSPEARFPVAIEQGYAVAQHICARAPRTASTPTGWPSPGTRWAATWPPR